MKLGRAPTTLKTLVIEKDNPNGTAEFLLIEAYSLKLRS
jgi:hypothetical protein